MAQCKYETTVVNKQWLRESEYKLKRMAERGHSRITKNIIIKTRVMDISIAEQAIFKQHINTIIFHLRHS